MAEELSLGLEDFAYANLAVRGLLLEQILERQVEPALALEPDLITLSAGGNDMVFHRSDPDKLAERLDAGVELLDSTGATLVLFTGFDVRVSPLLEPLRRRNAVYNRRVREVAARYEAVLVDYWCFDAFYDPRMWDSDRLHMSKAGHKYLAARVLDQLGVPHRVKPKDWEPPAKTGLRDWERRQRRWVRDWVLPLFARKLRGVTLGDELSPRWPEPVRVPPKAGLKKLAARIPAD
jgi:lysophospholipase L1-like esterase